MLQSKYIIRQKILQRDRKSELKETFRETIVQGAIVIHKFKIILTLNLINFKSTVFLSSMLIFFSKSCFVNDISWHSGG
jgi:hypothetical protein